MDYEITRKIFAIVQARPRALAGHRGSWNQMKSKRRKKETAKSDLGDQIKGLELI